MSARAACHKSARRVPPATAAQGATPWDRRELAQRLKAARLRRATAERRPSAGASVWAAAARAPVERAMQAAQVVPAREEPLPAQAERPPARAARAEAAASPVLAEVGSAIWE